MPATTHHNNDRIVNSNNDSDGAATNAPIDGSRGYPKPIGPVKPPPKPTREQEQGGSGETSDISCPEVKRE
ncbi:hypothetical protein GE21DRAFT_57 [Neurospora crassa]|uniref:Uncharacterized protein n=1 Tax=Neurospora crassa (strain ATCC 24698 / 74-OR23-1A / CBS 708.71 / DSM 1257 / FGSC 987) TaxID=367110 RepID=Q7SGJ5_NEUCR|nr:hypothetical protein NCU08089 [Neurospora crassa OR74A]EAA35984.1 hypothetical protein NCU08089 [Neurospora crassa OR74A]KHE84540.1 hypothetical protein GE21DRAFT_57 [Neurospora crassa]|eukprot:XP_965220.1 hypothetical protein NCU08089 [Neurospora crassa OR74A]